MCTYVCTTGHIELALQTHWCRQQKQSLQPSPGTWGLDEDQIWVTGSKMFPVFSHLFAELVQSFPYTLMQNPSNFLLEIGGRVEWHLSNQSVSAVFIETLM